MKRLFCNYSEGCFHKSFCDGQKVPRRRSLFRWVMRILLKFSIEMDNIVDYALNSLLLHGMGNSVNDISSK